MPHLWFLGLRAIFTQSLCKWELHAAEFHDNIGSLEDRNGQNPSAIPTRILNQLLLPVGGG
jgi:hypothetical protein